MNSLNDMQLKALTDFCKREVIMPSFAIRKENTISAQWRTKGIHYHDGYEYERGAFCSIEKISQEEYAQALSNIKNDVSDDGEFIKKYYRRYEEELDDYFISCYEDEDGGSSIVVYAKNFLKIEGYFIIRSRHWDTM